MEVASFTNENFEKDLETLRQENERKEAEELAAICAKHNVATVYKVSVPLNDTYTEFAVAYLKYPSFEAYSIALTLTDKHPLKGKKVIVDSAWLEGDERLKDTSKLQNLPLFYSLCTIIDEIMDVKAAVLKKKSMTTP